MATNEEIHKRYLSDYKFHLEVDRKAVLLEEELRNRSFEICRELVLFKTSTLMLVKGHIYLSDSAVDAEVLEYVRLLMQEKRRRSFVDLENTCKSSTNLKESG